MKNKDFVNIFSVFRYIKVKWVKEIEYFCRLWHKWYRKSESWLGIQRLYDNCRTVGLLVAIEAKPESERIDNKFQTIVCILLCHTLHSKSTETFVWNRFLLNRKIKIYLLWEKIKEDSVLKKLFFNLKTSFKFSFRLWQSVCLSVVH